MVSTSKAIIILLREGVELLTVGIVWLGEVIFCNLPDVLFNVGLSLILLKDAIFYIDC